MCEFPKCIIVFTIKKVKKKNAAMKGNPIYFMLNKRKLAKSGDGGLLCFNLERNMGQSNENFSYQLEKKLTLC